MYINGGASSQRRATSPAGLPAGDFNAIFYFNYHIYVYADAADTRIERMSKGIHYNVGTTTSRIRTNCIPRTI